MDRYVKVFGNHRCEAPVLTVVVKDRVKVCTSKSLPRFRNDEDATAASVVESSPPLINIASLLVRSRSSTAVFKNSRNRST